MPMMRMLQITSTNYREVYINLNSLLENENENILIIFYKKYFN